MSDYKMYVRELRVYQQNAANCSAGFYYYFADFPSSVRNLLEFECV